MDKEVDKLLSHFITEDVRWSIGRYVEGSYFHEYFETHKDFMKFCQLVKELEERPLKKKIYALYCPGESGKSTLVKWLSTIYETKRMNVIFFTHGDTIAINQMIGELPLPRLIHLNEGLYTIPKILRVPHTRIARRLFEMPRRVELKGFTFIQCCNTKREANQADVVIKMKQIRERKVDYHKVLKKDTELLKKIIKISNLVG